MVHTATEYFFPVSFVLPEDGIEEIAIGNISIIPRRWDVSFFDLATLGVNHKLEIPYELLHVYFQRCNLEVCIMASSLEDALIDYSCLRALFYVLGVTPYISPCVMSHSLNQIAGINTRDSDWLKSEYEELNTGIVSKTTTVEVHPLDLVLKSHVLREEVSSILSKHIFINAAYIVLRIREKYKTSSEVRNLVDGIIASPKIELLSQSLLHIWTIIESLFPSINTELSFRLSIYVSHMVPFGQKQLFEKVQKSYKARSKVSHGSPKAPSYDEWKDAWKILCLISHVVLDKGEMPDEKMIIDRIFSRGKFHV